ncbi:MAG: AAA family ATPase [Planctomycetota bacterium]
MAKLDSIRIENYKSIQKLDLQMHPLNVFIGPNGAGKSNFVGAFKFLNHLVGGDLQSYTRAAGGADRLLHYGRKQSEHMSFRLSFEEGVNGYSCALAAGAEDNLYFEGELVWFHDKQKYPNKAYDVPLGSGHLETRLTQHVPQRGSRVADYVCEHMRSWKLYHFHDTSDSARIKQTCDLADNRALHPDARNLSAFLYQLQQTSPDYFNNIQDTVRMVAPFFDRFTLEPDRLNPDKIRLEWKEKGTDTYFNGSSLSDGSLRFICLATLLLQPSLPSVILLDEPELGLHPYAIAVLADLLRAASQRSQVLVATQSVTLVNQFEPEQIVVVDRKEGRSEFQRLDSSSIQDWLDDYGLGDLWEKNIFGGRP